MSRDEIREELESAVCDARAWLVEADRLKRAADIIGTHFQSEANAWFKHALHDGSDEARTAAFALAPSYLMLAGYAIEDLAKGLIVALDSSADTARWVSSTHLCDEMMTRAAVELVDAEPDLVERLGHRIRWAGRYPTPHIGDALAFAESVRKRGFFGNPMRASTDDVRMVNELFDRMRQMLDAVLVA
jgi:hypothetical protein